MSYAIHIPASLQVLMEGLPLRTRTAIHGTLGRLARLAELWPPEDERWGQFVRHEGEGLRFYAEGCCVGVELQPELRRLVLREIGRVLVHLPSEGLMTAPDVLGSHTEH